MAIIAGFTLVVVGGLKRPQNLKIARAELEQIEGALDSYKSQYGVYPPSNPSSPLLNPLYYELTGVTNVGGATGSYQTLDGASTIPLSVYSSASVFDIGGALNCAKPGTDAESSRARNFLLALRQNRIGTVTISGSSINLLITSVRGPDSNYMPLGPGTQDINPFRYTYPGTNNPNSYDLWIDLSIKGKTNRISNWRQREQIL